MVHITFECPHCSSLFQVDAEIDATEWHTECPSCGQKYKRNPKEMVENYQKEKKAKKRKKFFKNLFNK